MDEDFLMLPLEEAEFSVIDVETTGLSPRYNNIIEIGIVKIKNLCITGSYQTLINPGRDIPYYITSMTGISNDDVYDAPFFENVVDDICGFINDSILAGHNFMFDLKFLKKEFEYCGRAELNNFNLCTNRIARRLYPELKSKSLQSLCRYFNLSYAGAHRALTDARLTAKVFLKEIEELRNSASLTLISDLVSYQYSPLPGRKQKIKKEISKTVSVLPNAPGIYYFLNSKNDIIYIGKAKSLRDRVKNYFAPSVQRKTRKIVQQASKLKIEITNSELTALLMEAELIKLVNPKHNTQLKQYGSKYFLRIDQANNYPRIDISNSFDFDGNDYFGLFGTKAKALAVRELIDKTFAVRECSDSEFSKKRKCFLADIERCTAPCINDDSELYFNELNKVYEFLYGKNQYALTRLVQKMKEYASKEKFEKAAEIKSLIDMILSQTHKTSLLSEPVNSANILIEVTESFGKDFLLMLTGKIYIKHYSIKQKDYFETALDDYFDHTLNLQQIPSEEDLEKMKITLNWLIRNRNKVKIYYLKNYTSKQELYVNLSRLNTKSALPLESTFDIRNFLSPQAEEIFTIVEAAH